jgi:glucose-1-phosphate thymidylyltransferase
MGEGCFCQNHLSASSDKSCTVCGDRVTIGPFTVIKDGLIGNNACIEGGKILEKEIPDNTLVM